jgi:uncharacterized protein
MNLSKQSRSKQIASGLIGAILCLELQGCAWLDQRLRQAAFRPTPASEADRRQLPADVEVYFVQAQPNSNEPSKARIANEQLSFLYFPSTEAQAPTVLYLHGVLRNALQNQPKIQAIRQAGFNVLALDYRGWGLSSSVLPSEESILADAQVGLSELIRREPRASHRIIFGHSMGGAVATALVGNSASTERPQFGGLVLESTFASVRSLTLQARWYGFIALPFLGNGFDSAKIIGKIRLPVWMMHGAKDTVVPLDQGQTLAQAAPKGTSFEVFENAQHSDLHRADTNRYLQIWRKINAQISLTR